MRSRILQLANVVGRINVTLDDGPIEYRPKVSGAYDWLPLRIPAGRWFLKLLH
jgi:hypothetical protein